MKLRAKIILTAASLALSCALLAGCGSSSGSTASSAASSEPASTVLSQASSIPLGEDNSTDALNAPFETLLNTNPISNQFEIAAMNIEYDFNLPAEDVVSYKGVKSNDNGDAGLVLVVEAAGPLRQCSALPPLPKGELTSAASVRGHLQQLFF